MPTELTPTEDFRADALGDRVHVGDIVAYTGGDGSRMRFGQVISLTPQGVRLMNFTTGGNPRAEKDYNRRPAAEKILKKSDQILLIRDNDNYKNVPGILLRDIFPDNH